MLNVLTWYTKLLDIREVNLQEHLGTFYRDKEDALQHI
jgi:hypothetical protein